MKNPAMKSCVVLLALLVLPSSLAVGDVVLVFDQSGGTGNFQPLDQDYGDNVISSPDSNGHMYSIITGAGFGLTPNVVLNYGPGTPLLWTTGYGDLTNVAFQSDPQAQTLDVTFTADPGFEVGLFGFDMAAYLVDLTVPGISVVDGSNNVLWSQGSTLISGSNHNDFDFAGGLFAESMTLSIDLSGLGNFNDSIGIDNIHFAQRLSNVPEPGSLAFFALAGIAGTRWRRRRSM